jgi:hypothetical protein
MSSSPKSRVVEIKHRTVQIRLVHSAKGHIVFIAISRIDCGDNSISDDGAQDFG